MNIDLAVVARDLRLPPEKIESSVRLLDEGNTIPFITRFRKDQTGGLNEEQLLAIKQRVSSLRSLAERKSFVKKSIESQSKLTEELAREIEKATTARRLEDLYHPFKAKKQSRAQTARHQGLEPLANEILAGDNPNVDMSSRATDYVRVDKGLDSVDDVIKGVGDLLAEKFAEDSELRSRLRKILWETGSLVSQPATPANPPAVAATKANPPAKKKPAADKPSAPPPMDSAKTTEPPQTSAPATAPPAAETPTSESQTTTSTNIEPPNAPAAPIDLPAVAPANEASPAAEQLAPPTDTTPDTDVGTEKITRKMSAGNDQRSTSDESAAPDTNSATPGASAESAASHHPLTPAEPVDASPTVVTDPEAQPQIVADKTDDAPTDSAAQDSAVTDAAGKVAAPTSAAVPVPASAAKPTVKKKKKKKKKKNKDDAAFKDYYNFKQPIKSLPPHQVLAINRGERSNRLKVKIAFDEDQVTQTALEHLIPGEHPFKSFLNKCVQDALGRLIIPSLDREIRRELTEKSEKHAVDVFAANLKNLLLTPPLRNRRVMAIDPGFKSGCSVAILDNQGQFVASDHLFVVGKKERRIQSREKVSELVKTYNVDMIAIGNGVGCRETEQMVSDAIANSLENHPVRYVVVNEAGASIYSTSEVGREELPEQTPAVRSAISIGRRLQNPISELVKISPANIGVGMYQHDVKAKHLAESLDEVVQFCVNSVGVDVNNASPSLLKFVSGMNALTARRVYEYCKENGGIKNRQQLKEVSGLGEATFIQAAGFLRVRDGDNPLDSTSIHPESYAVAEDLIKRVDSTPAELFAFSKPSPPPPKPIDAPTGSPTGSPTESITEVNTEVPSEPELTPAPQPEAATTPQPPSTTAPEVISNVKETAPTDPHSPVPPPTETSPPVSPKQDAPIAKGLRSSQRKEIIDRITSLDLDAIAAEKQIGKLLMTDLVRAIKKPLWDPRDKISKPISRRGILKADDLKPEMQLEAQVVNVVDFGVFVDIGLGESCLVHVSQLSTRYISDPQVVYAVGDILKVWVSEVDAERRRVKLTAIRPGTKKDSGRPRRRKSSSRNGDNGKRQDSRPAHARPKFERKKTERRPPAKPKKVIPITDEMLKGDAPMRSFSDLLQFKNKPSKDSKKNGES